MNIAFVTAEMVPFAKVGGLADVAGALPPAFVAEGCRVVTLMPFYGEVADAAAIQAGGPVYQAQVPLGPAGNELVRVFEARLPGTDVPVFLFQNNRFFSRPGIYSDPVTGHEYGDAPQRYAFFAKACIKFLQQNRDAFPVDVLHCHDSHTAPAIVLQKLPFAEAVPRAQRVATALTIHNLAYQGIYPPESLALLDLPPELFYPLSAFEYYGKVNFMKMGLVFADVITTVSERYALEIQETEEYGCGLEGVLAKRKAALHGILNGIDDTVWNPRTDPLVPHAFGPEALEGKRENKKALLEAFGFASPDLERPVMGMIGRLVDQKGLDLVAEVLPRLAKEKAYLVILGAGLPKYHEFFQNAVHQFPDFLGLKLAFDNRMAHLIEAGADIFLMPSRFEPCGLNQMYSLAYGTVPVVRETGGLADTITPYNPATGKGNGFSFVRYEGGALLEKAREALELYRNKPAWGRLMQNGMMEDHSWRRSARRYVEVFQATLDAVRREG